VSTFVYDEKAHESEVVSFVKYGARSTGHELEVVDGRSTGPDDIDAWVSIDTPPRIFLHRRGYTRHVSKDRRRGSCG